MMMMMMMLMMMMILIHMQFTNVGTALSVSYRMQLQQKNSSVDRRTLPPEPRHQYPRNVLIGESDFFSAS